MAEHYDLHTQQRAIEYEFMPSAFVALENLDMDNSKDEVKDKKHGCDGYVRYHIWGSTKSRMCGCVWRPSSSLLTLRKVSSLRLLQ